MPLSIYGSGVKPPGPVTGILDAGVAGDVPRCTPLTRTIPPMTARNSATGRTFVVALALASLASPNRGRGAADESGTPVGARPEGTVTFNKDVAPLIFERCAS